MTIEQAWASTQAAVAKLKGEVESLFSTHPLAAQMVDEGATAGVTEALGELTTLANTEVQHVAPAEAPTIDALVDSESAKIDAALSAQIAQLTDQATAKKAALASLKGAAA